MNNQMITSDEKSVALEFVGKVRGYLSEAADSFFKIGYELHKAQEGRQFKALGYDSLEALSEDAFGFSKTQTYDLIKVYNACRSIAAETEMLESFKPYSFSQLAAMGSGTYASPRTLIHLKYIVPTDSVRAIKKYVSFFNKYTGRHSVYPDLTLQEWLAQEEARQAELESSEQLQLGELVEEEPEEQDETPGEIFRTSELQEVAEESEMEDLDEIEEETPGETESVSRETEMETQRYTFENRAQARAFMADYENWASRTGLWWLDTRCYQFKNGATVYAVWSMVLQDVESRKTGRVVHYYLSQNGMPAEVTKDQLEKYIAAHADEL